jgi:excisionase family DNA binding protein
MDNPNLLTVKEAAEYAAVSSSLLYGWCESKRLPHLRCGAAGKRGKILIHKEDLDSFLATLRVSARP